MYKLTRLYAFFALSIPFVDFGPVVVALGPHYVGQQARQAYLDAGYIDDGD
jgi:hypothetical protein